ncbi:MAG: MATE family efflux transporter, partial [candidate division Zixibacteria bacterium]|nr:MATE family efflux transporter [candidate division Zixibacteria bacterium]
MISSNVLNLILDPILIFGWFGLPAMGIRGAAIASVVSYTITFTVGLFLLYGGFTNIKLHLSGKVPMSIESMKKILMIGLPAWFGSICFSGSRLILTPLIAAFGTSVVAAYGVGNQVTHLGMMILVGIGLGLSSLIGHNIGGNKIERAKKTADQAVLLAVGIMIAMGLITFIFAERIMGLFFESPETIGYGVTMLQVLAIGFPFIGLFIMLEEIHVGVGLNTPPMVFNIIHAWLFEVIPIFILTKYFGFDQDIIWWVIVIALVLTSSIFYQYYRQGRWLTIKV